MILGQAFLLTQGGDVRTCAGRNVTLVPDIPYTEEVTSALSAGDTDIRNRDSRIALYRRIKRCDAAGRLRFAGLPAGKWIAATQVTWDAPTPYGPALQGGLVFGRVDTTDGDVPDLVVTR